MNSDAPPAENTALATEIMTLGSLVDAFDVLLGLADQPLPVPAAAGIVRLSRWARPHYDRYLAARYDEAKAIGEKGFEDDYHIPPEKVAEFDRALALVRAEPVPFDPRVRLDTGALSAADAVVITPAELEALGPFLIGF